MRKPKETKKKGKEISYYVQLCHLFTLLSCIMELELHEHAIVLNNVLGYMRLSKSAVLGNGVLRGGGGK
jgi:hypothetical protein